jgi:hypothetical protein
MDMEDLARKTKRCGEDGLSRGTEVVMGLFGESGVIFNHVLD